MSLATPKCGGQGERWVTFWWTCPGSFDTTPIEMTGSSERVVAPDVNAWLGALEPSARAALMALGELLAGAPRAVGPESAEQFTARCLGVASAASLVDENRELNPVARLAVPLSLVELIEAHGGRCEVGPGERALAPMWTQTDVGDVRFRHPMCLRVHFPAGTVLESAGCVVHVEARETVMRTAQVSVFVRPEHQELARGVLDRLHERGGALNPYRGRVVRALYDGGLRLEAFELPAGLTRSNVIVPDAVWTEMDLGVASVRDHHARLKALALGTRRGVLLCGPPGTGKSAVSAVIAREVAGDFTVIYVEARAGVAVLSDVVEEAQRIGGPVLLVLEDVDLWCLARRAGGMGLSELLQAMDIGSDARILTVASTNDATTLDRAAIRTGRFDSVVEVGFPDAVQAGQILSALLHDVPGGDGVDVAAVAAALPASTSGSDLREIVRRAVLVAGDTGVSTEQLLGEVGSGRYQARPPDGGMYL